jgi:hypothetical protein
MRIEPWLLQTVVYVGVENQRGDFIPTGTALLVQYRPDSEHFLPIAVTAKHVIEDIPGDWIYYRINQNDDQSVVRAISKKLYISHATTDLAIFYVDQKPEDEGKFFVLDRFIRNEWIQHYGGVGVGDDIAIIGLYTSHYGIVRNQPIARFGNVSAIPSEPISTGRDNVIGYLVEARSIAGLSGSPVFLTVPPILRRDGNLLGAPNPDYHPVGIVLGQHTIQYKKDDIDIPKWQHEEISDDTETQLIERGTGFSVVAHFDSVFELIESEGFREFLRKNIENSQ